MLAFIYTYTQSRYKNYSHKPEKKPEPVNGITVGYWQKLNRFTHGNLRRESNEKQDCQYTYANIIFLPLPVFLYCLSAKLFKT